MYICIWDGIVPSGSIGAVGRPWGPAGDVPAAHATICRFGQVWSHVSVSRAVPRPVTQKAQLRLPTRRTNLLSPGKETHNPPCRFMTIPVPGIAPELPKNPGNSSRNKAYVHPDPWGCPSTCSSCGASWAGWRSAAKHSRLGHDRRLQRFFVAGRPTGTSTWPVRPVMMAGRT